MSVRSEALMRGTERLREDGISSARLDSRLLLAHAMGISPSDVVTTSRQPDDSERCAFDKLIARRLAHEPVAYITGHREFWSLGFDVGPGVLIPRPDTEILVDRALQAFPDRDAALSAVDLGAGSAAILIAFLKERPNANGLAVEQSQEAMIWARRNIAKHGLHARCAVQGDDWLLLGQTKFDVIFSNPPYIPAGDIAKLEPDVRLFEPLAAFDGGCDGLDAYRALAPIMARSLTASGRGFLEIGQGQEAAVPAIMEAAGLKAVNVFPDLAGIPRCVVVTLC
jgi:release factor glutamine methyltransferase